MLRVDRRGRVRVPVERREALLEEFERSGLSGAAFAKLSGIKYPTFANWVTKRRGKSGTLPVSVGSGIRLLEAEASGPLNGKRSGNPIPQASQEGRSVDFQARAFAQAYGVKALNSEVFDSAIRGRTSRR